MPIARVRSRTHAEETDIAQSVRRLLERGDIDTLHLFESSDSLRRMREHVTPVRDTQWNAAVQAYLLGDWTLTKQRLDAWLQSCPEDGPGKQLLAFLEEQQFRAPSNWRGVRVLTEK